MKKILASILTAAFFMAALAACGNSGDDIVVITREDGSGTRGAFIELFGVEEKDASGNKVDLTTTEADVTNSTSVMLTTVASNKNAIGYVSLGSLNDTVKALTIDGVEATAENIKNGTYPISRPFMLAAKGELSGAARDFMDFILSAEGQKVIEDFGCIAVGGGRGYAGGASGKVTLAGSSSVSPVMEKLKEAYIARNPGVTVEIQQSDSSTGASSAIEGVCDIGMLSRALKDSETEKGLESTVIAMDGIAVIVSSDNSVKDLAREQVRDIYLGNTATWGELR